MKSGNPALPSTIFDGMEASPEPMTLTGTINKTAMLFAIVLIGATSVWNIYFHSHNTAEILPYCVVGAIGGFMVALITIFFKTAAPCTAPIYAALEGLALGGISALYEDQYPGIAIQAMALTFGTLFCMLVLY